MALCRCYRGGTCIITNEHEGSAACAAKNNDAGRNRWAPRRGPRAGGGGGSDLRRAAARLGELHGLAGDVVRLASYAPLFANNNSLNWNPNAIHFDSGNVFGTPSYWVQRLFMGR